MSGEAEHQLHADMVSGADRLKHEIGYNPTRFMQMVGESSGLETARHLPRGRDASDGFTPAVRTRTPRVRVETFALLPWYRELFTEEELATAERRLVGHSFDVRRFSVGRSPAATSVDHRLKHTQHR